MVSQQPDIILIDEVINPASAKSLAGFAAEGKRVYVGMRSASTFDAVGEWRKLVGDDETAMGPLRMAMSGRTLRRLCSACKLAFQPDPEYLRKLNLDPARVQKLFQARTTPPKDDKGNPIPCNFCQDLRYKGRFGVFELFSIDDEVRQVVNTGGSTNQIKTVFRKQRGQYLQEVALAQVVAGETSVQEVLRVLRSDTPSRSTAAAQRRFRRVQNEDACPLSDLRRQLAAYTEVTDITCYSAPSLSSSLRPSPTGTTSRVSSAPACR